MGQFKMGMGVDKSGQDGTARVFDHRFGILAFQISQCPGSCNPAITDQDCSPRHRRLIGIYQPGSCMNEIFGHVSPPHHSHTVMIPENRQNVSIGRHIKHAGAKRNQAENIQSSA